MLSKDAQLILHYPNPHRPINTVTLESGRALEFCRDFAVSVSELQPSRPHCNLRGGVGSGTRASSHGRHRRRLQSLPEVQNRQPQNTLGAWDRESGEDRAPRPPPSPHGESCGTTRGTRTPATRGLCCPHSASCRKHALEGLPGHFWKLPAVPHRDGRREDSRL